MREPSTLKRIDDGFATGEAAIAAVVLLAMILVAAIDTVVNNLAIRLEWGWAMDLAVHRPLVDIFLQRATIVLAFLGASLATHHDKHIAIDVLSHLIPKKIFTWIRAFVMLVASVVSFMLALVFYQAALKKQGLSLDYSVLMDEGSVHICDAPQFAVDAAGLTPPTIWCGIRGALEGVGVAGLGEPADLFRFIVPVMLVVIALRMLVKALNLGRTALSGEAEARPAPVVGAPPKLSKEPPAVKKATQTKSADAKAPSKAPKANSPAAKSSKTSKKSKKKKGKRR